jgi:signal transduction histidine kinase/ActR/RegA family two-component response regulator
MKESGKVNNFEVELVTKTGVVKDVILSGVVDGDTLSGMVMDITERRRSEKEKDRMQAQLLHAQKMEAVGTLAGGIAHDFNNMLQAVLGYGQLLLFGKEKDEPGYKDIQEIVSAAGRGRELTRQLLTFSSKVESKRQPLNLNHQVEQVRKLLERTIPKMIAIEIHLADDLETIDADPAQMEQVLMNLAVNAKDAMPEGGRLVIETTNTTLDDDYCKAHLEARTGDYVLLTVSDTGHGMDRKTQARIFEPFFTTKGPGKGTGLGLAMVYGIVKSHDGYIMCYSELGEGTTFKIYLPVIERRGETAEPKEAEVSPRGGTETILLVDDELAIRKLGERVLRSAGYTVVAAPDGESALELYRKEHEHIDLVMLDLIMPGMGGKRCLEELVIVNPHVKVIIATGYSANGHTKTALEAGARGCISKPYDARQMLKEVRDVLDED